MPERPRYPMETPGTRAAVVLGAALVLLGGALPFERLLPLGPAEARAGRPGMPGDQGVSGSSLPSVARRPPRASIPLPLEVDGWTRPDTVRLIRPDGLFDYMDGGAELYLSYRFRRCEVCEYTHPSEDAILVELYFMETADDAFGLLSLDWNGRNLDDGADPPRALYAGGLLRLRSDDLFVRVMTYRETPASEKAVRTLGARIRQGRPDPPPPACFALFPRTTAGGAGLVSPPAFFRTFVALNSVLPLGARDPLRLDLACSGIAGLFPPARGAGKSDAARPDAVLAIRYPDAEAAARALESFQPGAGRREVHVLVGRTLGLALSSEDGPDLRKEAEALARGIEEGAR